MAEISDTLISSVQRGNVYVQDVKDRQRRPFKVAFKTTLNRIASEYVNSVDDDRHIQNIQSFADSLSEDFSGILQNGRARIGVAQKGVNLFLKYLWSFDKILEPPHCPIDAFVLRAIRRRENWTQLDSVETYREIIAACRRVAGNLSLSQWELELWNRKAS